MKKTIFTLLILVVGFLTIFILYLKPTSLEKEDSEAEAISNQSTSNNSPFNTSKVSYSQQAQQQTLEILRALSPSELAKIGIPKYFQEKKTSNPIYFSFNHNKVDQLKIGEQFNLRLPESDLDQVAIVTDVEPIEDDIVRISGTFQDSPEDINYFSITQTKFDQYAIMKVFTEDGDYIIEVKDGIGMLNTGPINYHDNTNHIENESNQIDVIGIE